MTYHYGARGGPGDALWFLTIIEDRNGNATVIHVTTDVSGGRVTRVSDPAGRDLAFTYNVDGRCTRITTPDSREVLFGYDTHQNLISITDMAGYQAAYVYDENGFLKKMTTAGRVNRFAWKSRPGYEDATSAQDNAGDKVISSVTTSAGTFIKYELLADGGGVKRTDALGQVTTFESQEGRTTSITQPKGGKSKVVFNEQKLPAKFTDELGNVTEVTYNDKGYPTKVEDALGHETLLAYDASGNLVSRTDPLGHTWQFTYDANGNLATTQTPLNFVTSYVYHPNGRLWKTTDPRGGQSVNLYNAHGDLNSQTDPAGNTAAFTYDGVSRCIGMTDRAGRDKAVSYDANDRIVQIEYTSAVGSPKRLFGHDAFGQVSFTDELGHITSIERNDFGYITRLTDPLGNLTKTEYDPENLPTRLTDPLGRVTSTVYDSNGRPVSSVDAMGKVTTREYNAEGKLVKLTDARKAATTFKYDENSRLTDMTDPLGKKVSHQRDALGRVTVTTNARGQQIRLTYDADGRVTKKEHKDVGSVATFGDVASSTFDANNNLTSRTDAWGTTSWTYDSSNRGTSITYPGGKSATFMYNATGQISSITYPDGLVISYTYDAFHRQKIPSVFRSGNEAVGIKEDCSNVTSVVVTMGAETAQMTFQHDSAGRLVDVSRSLLPTSSSSVHSTYGYDANGRPTHMAHDLPSGTAFEWNLQYDAVGNVITETHAGGFNSLPLLPASMTASYDLGGRVKTASGNACTYDADGNLTTISGGRFQALYSAENKPASIQRKIGTETETAAYVYDGSGLRVRREIEGEVIFYHYGPGDRLLFTTDVSGVLLTRYIWGDRTLLAAVKGSSLTSGLRHYLTGRLMSVVGLADAGGNMLATYNYDPFGNCAREIRQPGFVDDNPFTFVGGLGVLDEGGGLFYMRQRFYDAATGRFLQKDPAGFEGGINLYAYASGNPVNSVDPAGTWDVNWARLTKGIKQLAIAGVGIGLVAVTAPVSGPVAGTLAAISAVNTVLSGSAGICNVVIATTSPNDKTSGEALDQVDSFGKVLGMGTGAIVTSVKAAVTGNTVDEKTLEENMKIGSGIGSTLDMAANGTRWNLPGGHVLDKLDRIATADSLGQAYGETAAVLIKESQSGEQPAPQANAPEDDSNYNWGGNE